MGMGRCHGRRRGAAAARAVTTPPPKTERPAPPSLPTHLSAGWGAARPVDSHRWARPTRARLLPRWRVALPSPESKSLNLNPLRTLPFDSPYPFLLPFPRRKLLRAHLCRGGHGFGDLGLGTPIAGSELVELHQQDLRQPSWISATASQGFAFMISR
ncbi:hypothetical protein PVAP13_5NG290000 [Panicum virgatum]|uniref:Uncharacterized protein n=1 Tax=Panicum virgatum TaxID=38727 RepID=A0A8T0RRW0_PANVG|nr:hypothetical protein PVAP13_5NG290000 [Panicum virgatum]